jgi:DNA-directed RNA polymerase subunit RPC12/RpoP
MLGSQFCPTSGCDGTTSAGRIVCSRCWHRIPLRLRRSMLRSYRAYLTTHDTESLKAYTAQCRAAGASLKALREAR